MASAPYYEIDYAGLVQRAWIVLIAGRYTSSTPQAPAQPHGTGSGTVTTATTTRSTVTPPVPGTPPRAPLDGRLQVKPADMCGGARLPDTHVSPPLAPAPNVKLLVTAGDRYDATKPLVELTTGADGTFMAQLPPGTYCITRAGRGAKPTQAGTYTDLSCLVARWQTCDAVATVPVKSRVAIDIDEPCSWSICYFGPPPP